MAVNYGKQFETQFKKDVSNLEGVFVLRLPDQQSGYYGTSQNICDFICYKHPNIYFLELKSIKGNTFPLTNFTQFNKLMQIPNYNGIIKGLIIWFRDHDKVVYLHVNEIDRVAKLGYKSININKLDEYNVIEIPSIKKRTLLSSDYSCIFSIGENIIES